MGRHTTLERQGAPDGARPGGDDDGHSPITRRQILGILGVAGTAAACAGGAQVVANRPGPAQQAASQAASEATKEAAKHVTNKPAAPAGLRAGATEVKAPVSGKTVARANDAMPTVPKKSKPAKTYTVLKQAPTPVVLDPDLHFARRLSYGLTPELAFNVKKMGYRAWVAQQLAAAPLADPVVDDLAKRYPLVNQSPSQLKALYDANDKKKDDDPSKLDYFAADDQAVEMKLARAFWSTNQIRETVHEVMADFFHVPFYTDKARLAVADFDRSVIRKHLFGKYADMLWAGTIHPAMLRYLDLADSDGRRDSGGKTSNINQNFSREILELFSVGAKSPLTGKLNYDPRTDVVNAAFALSGLSVDGDTMTFKYKPERHYVGPVKVMGWKNANPNTADGMKVAKSLVDYLSHLPQTGEYLASQFIQRFIGDVPSADLIKRAASAYLKSDTSILEMLKVIFFSPEMMVSVGAKLRRPLDTVAADVRTLGVTPDPNGKEALDQKRGTLQGLRDLRYQVNQLGQNLLAKATPDGFDDLTETWNNGITALGSWNLNTSLVQGWYKGLAYPKPESFYGKAVPKTYGDAVQTLTRRLLNQPLSPAHSAALVALTGKPAATPVGKDLSLGGKLVPVLSTILADPVQRLR